TVRLPLPGSASGQGSDRGVHRSPTQGGGRMSKNGWAPAAALGDLLVKNDRMTAIVADTEYREVTIRLWGKGVVERRTTTGSEIAAARRSVVKAGQFILSRID